MPVLWVWKIQCPGQSCFKCFQKGTVVSLLQVCLCCVGNHIPRHGWGSLSKAPMTTLHFTFKLSQAEAEMNHAPAWVFPNLLASTYFVNERGYKFSKFYSQTGALCLAQGSHTALGERTVSRGEKRDQPAWMVWRKTINHMNTFFVPTAIIAGAVVPFGCSSRNPPKALPSHTWDYQVQAPRIPGFLPSCLVWTKRTSSQLPKFCMYSIRTDLSNVPLL